MFKKMNKKIKRDGGFALLFSVLISSLLLTIGLSIFSIALKELAISTNARQSIFAFYAADSGREYVKYLDTKLGTASTFDLNVKNLIKISNRIPPDTGDILIDPSGDPDGPNFYVNIEKVWSDDTYTKINTAITSFGHDVDSGDKVERAIFQSY